MAAISSVLSNVIRIPSPSLPSARFLHKKSSIPNPSLRWRTNLRVSAATVGAPAALAKDSDVQRRLYVGNIPRTVTNEELAAVFGEHASVEKAEVYQRSKNMPVVLQNSALNQSVSVYEVMYDKYSGRSRRFAFVTMSTVEDATIAIEKLNETEIGGRKIKVNVTEKPLQTLDLSLPQVEESNFIDSPYKVYVGNLAKTVTSDILSKFFSEKLKVLSAKVSRVPGTSKSSGFGFVSFSSDEDVEAAISSFNNALLEGQKVRVNKA